jgi:hypothetical protein
VSTVEKRESKEYFLAMAPTFSLLRINIKEKDNEK